MGTEQTRRDDLDPWNCLCCLYRPEVSFRTLCLVSSLNPPPVFAPPSPSYFWKTSGFYFFLTHPFCVADSSLQVLFLTLPIPGHTHSGPLAGLQVSSPCPSHLTTGLGFGVLFASFSPCSHGQLSTPTSAWLPETPAQAEPGL